MTRYVDGAMSAASVNNLPGFRKKTYTDAELEQAMSDAIKQGMADGLSLDSDEMRARILNARRAVKNGPTIR